MTIPIKALRKAALSALLPALLGFAPLAAHAATFTFAGQTPSGSDPLGGVYQIGPFGGGITNFEEDAGLQPDPTQQVLFNPLAGGLANAASFTLAITGGADKLIALSQGFGLFFETFQPNGDILSEWTASENAGKTAITFTAPKGDQLVAGQRFDVDVTFKNPLPNDFAYAITWGGAAVPEPATWAMMIVGLGLIGGVLRRDRRSMGLAAA